MPLTIRDATTTVEAGIIALWRECDLVTSYNDPASDFRFAVAGPASSVLVAVDDDSVIVGSVMVGHDGYRGWLYYVATATRCRKLGIGRQNVGAAENWLCNRGVVKAQLLVRDTNSKVVTFYEYLGFETAPRTVMGKWLGRSA